MEGAIRDDRDHIKDLKKDIEDNEKKLAKLKKDYKKDVVKENAISEEPVSAAAVAAGIASIFGGSVLADKLMSKAEAGDFGEKGKEVADALKKMGSAAGGVTQIRKEEEDKDEMDEAMRGAPMYDEDDTMREQEDVDVEDDVDVDVKDEEDVDVDVKRDVDIDDESAESDIEVKSEVPGESADVSAILGLLTKAQERAEKMGDEKLMDQIGNTITYYTRAHVVAEAKDEDLSLIHI